MRNLLLSAARIALPVGIFAVAEAMLPQRSGPAVHATAGPSLGDMSGFSAIVTDVRHLAAARDLSAAGKRITDLETA